VYRKLHNTTEYLLSYVDFQNTNFVVVILDSLFKTGKSGTQWYCVIPGMNGWVMREKSQKQSNSTFLLKQHLGCYNPRELDVAFLY